MVSGEVAESYVSFVDDMDNNRVTDCLYRKRRHWRDAGVDFIYRILAEEIDVTFSICDANMEY